MKPVTLTIALCVEEVRGDDVGAWLAEHPSWQRMVDGLVADPGLEVSFLARPGGEIARQRNEVMAAWLKVGTDWLLFRDGDIEGGAEEVQALLARKKAVVGGCYCKREPGGGWVFNAYHGVEVREDGLLPVAELGTGFMLIHRGVPRTIIDRLPGEVPWLAEEKFWGFFENRWIQDELGRKRWVSEDYYFCWLCRRAGVGILSDTRVMVGHVDHDGTSYPLQGRWPELPRKPITWKAGDAARILPEKPLVVVLSHCSKDIGLARKWLARAKRFGLPKEFLEVGPEPLNGNVKWVRHEDRPGIGYPAAANEQFVHALEAAGDFWPGQPVLFCEADTFLIDASWYQRISEEYLACGRPFLGHVVKNHAVPHLAGCAVYPGNWEAWAPSLGESHPFEAWDTACAWEIVGRAAQAKTIFQIWRPDELSPAMIPDGVALFHQDKSGVLYDLCP